MVSKYGYLQFGTTRVVRAELKQALLGCAHEAGVWDGRRGAATCCPAPPSLAQPVFFQRGAAEQG
jgi:hypothetical protein